jgi:large subunit ribosomal protein LX
MSEFTVSGRFQARQDTWQPFEKRMDAPNENVATEHVYTEFGSRHGLRRGQITIGEVTDTGSETEATQ